MRQLILISIIFGLGACATNGSKNSEPVDLLNSRSDEVGKYWLMAYRAPPIYPVSARKADIQGCVLLSVVVTSSGRARDVQVIKSEPESIFDRSAIKALRAYKWKPAPENSARLPIRTGVRLTFGFSGGPPLPKCELTDKDN